MATNTPQIAYPSEEIRTKKHVRQVRSMLTSPVIQLQQELLAPHAIVRSIVLPKSGKNALSDFIRTFGV